MLEELKEENLISKVGGRFRLSTLIQKRTVALNRGAKALVNMRTNDLMEIAIQEILQDKIYLDESGAVRAVEDAGGGAPAESEPAEDE